MTTKTKIIIGVSVLALVGGYLIYKRMRINKPMDNAIKDKDGKVELPLAPPLPPPLKEAFPVYEEKKRFAVDKIAPRKQTVEEVKEINRLIALP